MDLRQNSDHCAFKPEMNFIDKRFDPFADILYNIGVFHAETKGVSVTKTQYDIIKKPMG
jgi:hypothetical protein